MGPKEFSGEGSALIEEMRCPVKAGETPYDLAIV